MNSSSPIIEEFLEQWHKVVANRDLHGFHELLEDNVSLNSPVSSKPITGRETISFIFMALLTILDDFTYYRCADDGKNLFLEFSGKLKKHDKVFKIEGVDVFKISSSGKVAELTVMMRPLTALQEFATQMSAKLSSQGENK